MFKNLNFLFIFLFLIILGVIGLFNYIIDPYNIIFDRPTNLKLSRDNVNLLGATIKFSSKSKYSTIVFGSSLTTFWINKNLLNRDFAFLAIDMVPKEIVSNYVKFFISIHPETRTVIFPVEYAGYYFDSSQYYQKFPVIKNKNLTIKEFTELFLSNETTKLSLKKLLNNYRLIFNKERYINNNEDIYHYFDDNSFKLFNNSNNIDIRNRDKNKYVVYVDRNYSYNLKGLQKNTFQYLKENIESFENHNIDVTYIIPPYHALMQSKIYKEFNYEDIENIKRLLTQKTNGRVIDFAYINKYTTENLKDTYLYNDINHPITYKYNLFYCVLNNLKEYKDKNIYVELTKDNIEKVLKEQRLLLEQYISNNHEYINDFLRIVEERNDASKWYSIEKNTQNAPACTSY